MIIFDAKLKQVQPTLITDVDPIEKAISSLAGHVASIKDITSRTSVTSQNFHELARSYLRDNVEQARIYAMAAYNTTLPGLACKSRSV